MPYDTQYHIIELCAGCSSVNTIAVFKDEKWPTPKDGMRNACSTACILLISS